MLGIIPACGTSKTISKKNLAIVGGKPLLQWTVEAAKASQKLTDLVVSTEDEEIAMFAAGLNVRVLERPKEYAARDVASDKVCEFVLENQLDLQPTSFALLQPTSPLRTAQDIDDAITMFEESNAACLVAVKENSSQYMIMEECEDGTITPKHPDIISMDSQDYPRTLVVSGLIYIAKVEEFLAQGGDICNMENTIAFEGDPIRSLDADSELAFKLANDLLK